MAMQQVSSTTIGNAKNRMKELREFISQGERNIAYARNAYSDKKTEALRDLMLPSEYLTLFPSPPADSSFTAENAQIVAKKAERVALTATLSGDVGDVILNKINHLQQQIDALEMRKQYVIGQHAINAAKPQTPLSMAQFTQLHPEPDLSVQIAAIATAATELNLLGNFMRSGVAQPSHYDLAGSYDTAFLAGTTIVYP